jgi:hypothetical protein
MNKPVVLHLEKVIYADFSDTKKHFKLENTEDAVLTINRNSTLEETLIKKLIRSPQENYEIVRILCKINNVILPNDWLSDYVDKKSTSKIRIEVKASCNQSNLRR